MTTKQTLAIAIPVTVAATIGAAVGLKAIGDKLFNDMFNTPKLKK